MDWIEWPNNEGAYLLFKIGVTHGRFQVSDEIINNDWEILFKIIENGRNQNLYFFKKRITGRYWFKIDFELNLFKMHFQW
jgi:hypothetical protein